MFEHYLCLLTSGLRSIPDVIWAAATGSFLTIIGVLVTNRSRRLELVAQLKHDSEQRDREREMSLKRDVYVPAFEAVSKLPRLLGGFADLNAAPEGIYKEATGAFSAIAKMQLVATNKTVQALTAFLNEYGTSYLELLLRRSILLKRKAHIELLQSFIDKTNKEQERWVEELKQVNLSGELNQAKVNVINANFAYGQDNYKKFSTEQNELQSTQNTEHFEFSNLCFEKSMKLARLAPELLFAAREELELDIDQANYLLQFNDSIGKGEKVFQWFLLQARAQLEEKNTETKPQEKQP